MDNIYGFLRKNRPELVENTGKSAQKEVIIGLMKRRG